MNSDSRKKLIPPNDPRAPRWLRDLHDWKLERYIDIARTIETEGYAGSKDNGTLPIEPKAYFEKIVQLLTESRKLARCLVSGWKLQEGVLLPETILIDDASNALEHDTFMHNGGQASVIDLTARVTKPAIGVPQSFLLQANGKEPQSQSRKFGMEQDSRWELIEAMELEDVTVKYKLPMDEIKRIFHKALFEKCQWSMLLVPQPSFSVNKRQSANGFKWINNVSGLLIPVGVFVYSQIGLASQSMLPRISLDNAIKVTVQPPKTSQTFTLWKNLGIKWYLHYVQTEAGVEIRSPASKTNPTPRISDAVFLKARGSRQE
ncbi:hypothetical protein BOTNAR_0420g00090 [Botryotinia narcissicola]|uniref:Uncharacterized protein n=1 Tax=Botryotinia narcissicola TaxID=278944 RepID=A0A4Z1HLF7_9HELO|nr:hypothetical protein BOTNAR_0420g00090 [Botryotinia narcissicola]